MMINPQVQRPISVIDHCLRSAHLVPPKQKTNAVILFFLSFFRMVLHEIPFFPFEKPLCLMVLKVSRKRKSCFFTILPNGDDLPCSYLSHKYTIFFLVILISQEICGLFIFMSVHVASNH